MDVGSAVSWMEGDSRHHGRVLEMGEDRDYRPEPREGDTTRKDYGVAGVHEGTVISLPRKGSPFYRIRLDKDDEDDDTDEEDMTWSELAAVTKQQASCTARPPAAASPVFLFSVASFCTGMRR